MTDSAFCELETDSVTENNFIQLDLFRLLHADNEDYNHQHCSIDSLPKVSFHYEEHCRSSTTVDSQSLAEAFSSDSYTELLDVEELENSDTESVARSTEWESSSSIVECSSSSCHSDSCSTFPIPAIPHKNEQVADDGRLLPYSSQFADKLVASSSNTSNDAVVNESQLSQHQPLLFFIIGLFVGLSLGFFTCKCTANVV